MTSLSPPGAARHTLGPVIADLEEALATVNHFPEVEVELLYH
jgi:hypothetical protein